ncbi:mother-specific HO expression [Paecilomyces lecythidis]
MAPRWNLHQSGRVIHNLQEDIARLTRECSLQRSRAEEAQRNNEALKTQLQNMTERVRNLELSHEANLHSISRKDRKIEELRGEIQTERERRENAEGETRKIHQIMADSRDDFNRKCAELQEIANYSQTQYDVLAKTGKRDKADMQKKLNTMREDFANLQRQNNEKDIQLQRLDVIMAQKNREIETATERTEKLLESYDAYRKGNDQELRQMIERGHEKDKIIDEALASLKETEAKMKWTIQVKNEVKGAE